MKKILLLFIKSIVIMSFATLGFIMGMLVNAIFRQWNHYIVCTIVIIGFTICGILVTNAGKSGHAEGK